MKKQLLTGLALAAAVSMLCGFDSAETLDSLNEKMTAASADTKSASMTMDLNVDLVLNVAGEAESSMPVTATGSIQLDSTIDPAACKMVGSIDFSALMEGQTIPVEAYYVTEEDGTLKAYMKNPLDDTWTAQTADGLNVTDIMNASVNAATSFSDMADWGLSFELAPEAADVDGTECYLVSTVIGSDAFNTLIQKASEKTGQDLSANENVALALSLLSGVQAKLEYYVDAATFLPAKLHIDFNDSDLSAINQLLSGTLSGGTADSSATSELVLNDLSMDISTDFGNVAEITVPDEVLAAVASASEATAAAE